LGKHWFSGEGVKECVVEKLRKEGSCSVDADGRGGIGQNNSISCCDRVTRVTGSSGGKRLSCCLRGFSRVTGFSKRLGCKLEGSSGTWIIYVVRLKGQPAGIIFITYNIIHECFVREGWTTRPLCLAFWDLLDLEVRLAVKSTF